ncbi:hypothetical protein GWI33_016295, partial [Rhynchophorus ferrugineus]
MIKLFSLHDWLSNDWYLLEQHLKQFFRRNYIFDEPASVITCRDYLPRIVTASVADNESIKFTIYPIGLAISAIFLAATLAAGSLLPASHHVLHWRCQTNYVACLLIGDVLLCITQVVGATLTYTPCFTI